MVEMLFGKLYEEYDGEDMSALIGDEWKDCSCDEDCIDCLCEMGED